MSWPPASFGESLLAAVVFGLTGIVLILFGFKVFDWMTPGIKIEHELAEKHNIAVAIVIAAMILAVSIVIAAAVTS
jgi:putative membrane protein